MLGLYSIHCDDKINVSHYENGVLQLGQLISVEDLFVIVITIGHNVMPSSAALKRILLNWK